MKPLKCLRCTREIPFEVLKLETGRGSCKFCGTPFRFHYQAEPEPKLVALPDGFSINREGNQTQIAIAWFNSSLYGMFPLALVLGFGAYGLWNQFDSLFWQGFLTLGVLFGLYTLYYAFAVLVNKTQILIHSDSLQVKAGPIPMGGNVQLNVSQIKSISHEQKLKQGEKSKVAFSYVVFARGIGDVRTNLVDGLDVSGARLIESEIKQVMKVP
jgi:hypothetical protein